MLQLKLCPAVVSFLKITSVGGFFVCCEYHDKNMMSKLQFFYQLQIIWRFPSIKIRPLVCEISSEKNITRNERPAPPY